MFLDILVTFFLTALFLGAVFFVPKWLYWITPHASSAYEALAGQYGPKVAMAVYAALVAVVGTGLLLLSNH